jgi:hypothetical protein
MFILLLTNGPLILGSIIWILVPTVLVVGFLLLLLLLKSIVLGGRLVARVVVAVMA